MSRNNVKLLTPAQLDKLNEKYIFDFDGSSIIVRLRYYNRVTKHDPDKPFHINSKIRKVCFNLDAIELWLKLRKSTAYSLFDVQQAVNIAYVTYADTDEKTILHILQNPVVKIKEASEED